jgi:hypothetical protein
LLNCAIVLGAGQPPIVPVARTASASWYWMQLEYLRWNINDMPLDEPLVTSGPPVSGGVLGNPGTEILFGDSDLDFPALPGARLSGGILLNSGSGLGLEASGFALGQRSVQFSTTDPAGGPVVARPFIDAQTGLEDAEPLSLISSPAASFGAPRRT